MSILTKFATLLGAIGITVVFALSVSVVAMNFMYDEVRRPFQVMSSALIDLQTVKYALENQRNAVLGIGADSPTDDAAQSPAMTQADHRAVFEVAVSGIGDAMRRLAEDERVVTVTGKTSLANLRTRISSARELSEQWFTKEQPPDRQAAAEALLNAHALTRRIESRIIADTHDLLTYATDLRPWILAVMGFALMVLVLMCLLGLLLVRRWVVRPVAELRTAAARIAAGDFAHRIPVQGRDELTALSTEVNTMASVIKAMQDEAVQRERLAAVGEVVRRIAHNLRSPLAGIRGLAELSRKELESPAVAPGLRADVGENQQRIIGAVDRFEHWLKDLLDSTRPLEVVHQTLDPREWLERVIEAYRPKAQAAGIALELDATDAPELAAFDPRHLEHAVGALISNALDAVAAAPPKGEPGRVELSCRRTAREDGGSGQAWELRIRDNGPGVPVSLRERIFAPYFTTKQEGTGIGLALALQVVRAHGGSLTLLDTPNGAANGVEPPTMARGAVFSARMPIGPIDVSSSRVATAGHPETPSGQNSRH